MVTPLIHNKLEGPDELLNKFPGKCRRRKSVVWDHFTIENVGSDKLKACCNQCNKSFAYFNGSKPAGTSHLKRHITTGSCPGARETNHVSPSPHNEITPGSTKKRKLVAPRSVISSFSQDLCNYEIAKMIILHDYPLHMVEHRGFVEFTQTLQPQFNKVSFESIQGVIMATYLREKLNLSNLFSGILGRVSLALDLWTSDENVDYAVLSGQFIDCEWKLHRRVLNVVMVPFPDSEVSLNHALVTCLSEWGLESKLFTLTLDRSFASEAMIGNLRGLLAIKNPHMSNGQFLIGSCYARCLSSFASRFIDAMKQTVQKVRDCVKYVKTSGSLEEKFMEIKQQLQVPSTKNLVVDNQAKWDSTYHMLSAAFELKEVFGCLDTSDPGYREAPSMDEWNQIKTLCDCLKLFFEAASILTSQTHQTADKFFEAVCNIQLLLIQPSTDPDPIFCSLILALAEKFERYWKDCCLILAMAVVMDPRYKLKLVKFKFSRIYGDHQADTCLRIVEDGIHELYLEYVAQSLPLPSIHVGETDEGYIKSETPQEQDETLLFDGDPLCDFDVYISDISSNHHTKSELDQYLEESLQPRDQVGFEVLDWWKMNRLKYPVLSIMAADILSIPLSTVSADSVFEISPKKVDSYKHSLGQTTLEALVCAKDWLQCGMGQTSTSLITGL